MVMSRHLRVHLVGFLALASHAFLVPQHRYACKRQVKPHLLQ